MQLLNRLLRFKTTGDGQEFSFVCSQQQSLPFSRLGQFYFQAHSLNKN